MLAANLVLCAIVWWMAASRAGAVRAIPVVAVLTVTLLLLVVPKVLWPDAPAMHRGGAIASLTLSSGLSVVALYRIIGVLRRRRGAG